MHPATTAPASGAPPPPGWYPNPNLALMRYRTAGLGIFFASCFSASTRSIDRLLSSEACGCRVNAPAGWGQSSWVRVRGGAVVSDQYNARMQVMITRNMRKVRCVCVF